MTGLPEGVQPGDEVSLTWEHTEDGTKIVASLGEASITVESTEAGAPAVPWLAASLNHILETAWALIEAEEQPDNQQEEQ